MTTTQHVILSLGMVTFSLVGLVPPWMHVRVDNHLKEVPDTMEMAIAWMIWDMDKLFSGCLERSSSNLHLGICLLISQFRKPVLGTFLNHHQVQLRKGCPCLIYFIMEIAGKNKRLDQEVLTKFHLDQVWKHLSHHRDILQI